VHVALLRRQIRVSRKLLNRPRRRTTHRQVRTERVPQHMGAGAAQIRATRLANVRPHASMLTRDLTRAAPGGPTSDACLDDATEAIKLVFCQCATAIRTDEPPRDVVVDVFQGIYSRRPRERGAERGVVLVRGGQPATRDGCHVAFRSRWPESRPPRHEGDVPLRPSKDVVVLPFELEKHVLWAARRPSLISSCG
jgi:hypothetical protein